jgi:dUTP pyrophosphatase
MAISSGRELRWCTRRGFVNPLEHVIKPLYNSPCGLLQMEERVVEGREIDEQLGEMMERIGQILSSHPAAIYLPCFYRSGPPCVFLMERSVQVLVRGPKVLHYEVEPFDLVSGGYEEVESGDYYLAYEFLPGKAFELELQGMLMEKRLPAGGLVEEVRAIRECLGIYDLVPLLEMRRLRGTRTDGVPLRIRRLDASAVAPAYAHAGDAGLDLCSIDEITLQPGERATVSTGFAMALPEGYAAFVQPRSGLAARKGVSIVNTPGLIDCHYRGEVKVILVNLGSEAFHVKRGDRIAQMVIQGVEAAEVEVVEELDETIRGGGGFGSTGT